MGKIFKAYVGRSLKKALADTDWNVSLQDRGYYLFERKSALKPDIVVERNDITRKIILDTKWKALYNNPRSNYDQLKESIVLMIKENTDLQKRERLKKEINRELNSIHSKVNDNE
ncbi:5-methylcytosine restriction system specificity protein McrC [Bacillus paranthracis]|uniref:5-methylcytosine restriction system specificity protein McrC n=1 Tax=Bacillus TaxID=1386 RepID=UPI0005DDDCE8|nr:MULTISPECIES: hypothetical protein [Bacillus]KXI54253.1 hypothetical protein ACS45_05315 [Bacillus cereus]CKE81061.1 McrBC 5-methylcytosine restriction system component [Streptococcus pneumoniae]KAB7634837.1 hypothetical protein GBN96_18720 [Bacillus sp. B4-WWTP-NA-D-NA-NA]MCZ7523325.1 hypothetical protein [Bacillus pacificus]MDA1574701.1 hypothetical protein [Bacillus cereus group sp. TH242-3LC]